MNAWEWWPPYLPSFRPVLPDFERIRTEGFFDRCIDCKTRNYVEEAQGIEGVILICQFHLWRRRVKSGLIKLW